MTHNDTEDDAGAMQPARQDQHRPLWPLVATFLAGLALGLLL